jgi:hypothetical protein
MNFDTKPKKVIKIGIGDKVSVLRASASSIELYTTYKSRGVKRLHCPCSSTSTDILEVTQVVNNGNGLLLREVHDRFITCAVVGDVKRL